MKMRYLKSVMVTFLSLAVLLVFDSCSTSKKTATRKGDAIVIANAPDYKQIKREINTKGSEFYYPDLLRRFEEADTTLTAEQLHYFYFGTATRPDYNPYKADNFAELKGVLNADTLKEDDWRRAAEIVDKQLKANPTSLRFHIYKEVVFSNLYGRESKPTSDAHNQVVMLFSTIAMTGNGQSAESAFHVICVPDEYGMMDLFGFSPKSQALVEKHGQSYDVIDLQENEYGLESLYFNITKCTEALQRSFGF